MKNRFLYTSFIFLFLFNGCTLNTDISNTKIEHKKETQELDMIMHEFNILVYDNTKSELELDNIRRRYALSLAENIEKLIIKIDSIPNNELQKYISKKSIKPFKHNLIELQKRGQEIYKVAKNYELEKLDTKIEHLKQTCIDCHTQVRVY